MLDLALITDRFKNRQLLENVSLARFTTSRVGGDASCLIEENDSNTLAEDVKFLWENSIPFFVLGKGSNVLIRSGILEMVVLLNRTNKLELLTKKGASVLRVESGANLASVSRFAQSNNLTGLEWASTVPGTVGGAVYGNAGAHGLEMSHNLIMAHIVHRENGIVDLTTEGMAYSYRSSILKRSPGNAVILAAELSVQPGEPESIRSIMEANAIKRRASQPGGSSMGSTFKNPVDDSAGRLIDNAGLKGTKIGGVEVSQLHANFFINDGTGTPEDYFNLINHVRETVFIKSEVKLELEIELLGDWQDVK
jgi:UDP-N-acetylmuramate dehydrogenase